MTSPTVSLKGASVNKDEVYTSRKELQKLAKEEWVSWLSANRWTAFFTLTFAPPEGEKNGYTRRGVSYCWKSWERFVETFDCRWDWFVVQEKHQSGAPHLHGLLRLPRGENVQFTVRNLSEKWLRDSGICRWEPILETGAVAAYVSKYVVKDEDVSWRSSDGLVVETEVRGWNRKFLRSWRVGGPEFRSR